MVQNLLLRLTRFRRIEERSAQQSLIDENLVKLIGRRDRFSEALEICLVQMTNVVDIAVTLAQPLRLLIFQCVIDFSTENKSIVYAILTDLNFDCALGSVEEFEMIFHET